MRPVNESLAEEDEYGTVHPASQPDTNLPTTTVSPTIDVLNISANHHRHRRFSEGSVVGTPKSETNTKSLPFRKKGGELESHVLAGLTLAGLAATMLHTVHTYQMEQLSSSQALVNGSSSSIHRHFGPYSAGAMILKTLSYVVGAWWVDSYAATRRNRTDAIGAMGFGLAAIFLVSHWHTSLAPRLQWAFECTRSVYILILASPIIDDHRMSPVARIQFMASGQCINLGTALIVRWMCELFSSSNSSTVSNTVPRTLADHESRIILLLLAIIACILFTVAQTQIASLKSPLIRLLFSPLWKRSRVKQDDHGNDDVDVRKLVPPITTEAPATSWWNNHALSRRGDLDWRRVVRDLCRSQRFRMWLGMEVLMESHIAIFHVSYLHEFVYNHETDGLDAKAAWALVLTRKVAAIVTYLPMALPFGYAGVYRALFYTAGGLSIVVLVIHEISPIASVELYYFAMVFLLFATVAVHSAGFQLAMADLSLEMHYRQVLEGRIDDPSLAGVLIGANAVVCKPVAYLVSMLVTYMQTSPHSYYLLTLVPFLGSAFQLWFWNRYDLTPRRTAAMREELFRNNMTGSDLPR
jgi:hypothetical protein